jgi:hypothetical protein
MAFPSIKTEIIFMPIVAINSVVAIDQIQNDSIN